MHEGVLQQVGSPEEVYQYPANLFVAQFVGSPVMNIAKAAVSETGAGAEVRLTGAAKGFDFPRDLLGKLTSKSGDISLGIRPEGVLVERTASDGYLPVEASIIEPLGSHDIVDLKVGDQMLRARTKSGFVAKPGDRVFARVDPSHAHFFDTMSGQSLGVRL
jgi:multiple sugar transport system ATP-binding protein